MGKSWKRLVQRRRRDARLVETTVDTPAPKKTSAPPAPKKEADVEEAPVAEKVTKKAAKPTIDKKIKKSIKKTKQ